MNYHHESYCRKCREPLVTAFMDAEKYWNTEGIRYLNPDCSLPSLEERVKEAYRAGFQNAQTELAIRSEDLIETAEVIVS